MPVRRNILYNYGTYFITFTCHKWIPLLQISNGYDIVYEWFRHLRLKGHFLNGYVIMPNHVHVLISFKNTGQSINTIVGNGKRFMAYSIIEKLKTNGRWEILDKLSKDIEKSRAARNKQHNVWELSFDWKECRSPEFMKQKLDYIHFNPCSKKWVLCNYPGEYAHSSAMFYECGLEGKTEIYHYMEMEDQDLSGI